MHLTGTSTTFCLLLLVSQLMQSSFAYIHNDNPDTDTYLERLVNLQSGKVATNSSSILLAVVPVYGNSGCDYSAAVYYGNNLVLLTLDTGSSNNAVASTTCSTCGNSVGYPGNPSASGQFTANYGTSSQPSSWTGYLTTAPSTVAGDGNLTQSSFTADVAVILQQTNFFSPQCNGYAQGILGLAYAPIAQHGSVSYADFLAKNGAPDAFALQLCPPAYPTSPQQQTGNWWIGGYPSSYLASAMVFTPITEKYWYGVQINSISISSTPLSLVSLNAPRAIVDSGTSSLVFSNENFNTIVNALISFKAIQFSPSVDSGSQSAFWAGTAGLVLTANQFQINQNAILNINFADMTLNGTVQVPVYPNEYIRISGPDNSGFYNVSLDIISSGMSAGSGQVATIIGLPAHLNKIVYYDRGNDSRIGFAVAKPCQMTGANGGLAMGKVSELDVVGQLNPNAGNGTPSAGERTMFVNVWTIAAAVAAAAYLLL